MENSKQIQSGTSRQNIDKQIRNYRRNQTLFVIVSVVINALIIAFLTIYYSIRQRALVGALYLYDKDSAVNMIDRMMHMNISMNTYNSGTTAMVEAGYTKNGYAYLSRINGENVTYIVISLIMAGLFICGIIHCYRIGKDDCLGGLKTYAKENELLKGKFVKEHEYNICQYKKMQEFVENIAHQIKTPLAAIILNLEFMQELHMDERMGRLVDESAGSAFRIRDFIRTLLNISRFENKKVIIAADEVLIGSIISDSINNCMNGMIHENQNDIFIVQYDDKCESAVIYADEMWLVEAIANVIGNSADYIRNISDGKVYITAGCDERKVVIRIEDNGNGLTVKDQDDIFDRFSTTRNSASDMHVGLGLNLSRLIIEAHYGIIKAGNSEEYGGAEFTIILPRYRLKDKR